MTTPHKDAIAHLASSPNAWRQQGETIELLGQSIFVIDSSDGDESLRSLPVVLMIHGFPTSSWDWQPMWRALSEHYRLISLDMLGFGFSDKPENFRYSIHAQADFIEALLNAKRVEKVHVLAHDYGDTVAQELLARQLENKGVSQWLSCCFLNGGLFPETHRALMTQKLLLSPLGKWINRLTGYKKFCRSFSSVFGPDTKPSEDELQQFWWVINQNNGKHVFHNLITYMRDRIQHRERWVGALQASSLPLALINGTLDPVSGGHMVRRYQELNCRLDYLAELPLIGHYPQVEAPNEVARHYLTFLNQCTQSESLKS
jgi:pimeloyl-ACP methyl ester carboxylesterase